LKSENGVRSAAGFFAAERNHLMPHQASCVGGLAEQWIPDHIKIREPAEAERFADPMPSGLLNVKEEFRRIVEPQPRKEGQHTGSGILRFGRKTVWPLVRRVKSRVPLGDEIGLPGNPDAAQFGMRKHRWRFIGCWIVSRG
jgi:hypothetical protein